MPQQDMFAASARTIITWTYSTDPLKPHDPSMFYVVVNSARNQSVEHGLCMPPTNVIHEEVAALLRATWDAYLFGEPGDVRKAVNHVHPTWSHEAVERIHNIR